MEKPQPAYRHELFVNHTQEIELVENIVQDALDHKAVRTRAITFYGERGSGKTWLIRHLGKILPEITRSTQNGAASQEQKVNVLTLFLAPPKVELDQNRDEPRPDCLFFGEPPLLSSLPTPQIIEKIVRWVCSKWGVVYDDKTALPDLIYWLGRDLPRQTDAAFVLLVDSIFEFGNGTDRLPLLEDQLLAPLASLENGLVVMTGRGAPFPWRSVSLRQAHIEKVLQPFGSEQDIEEQLRRCDLKVDPERAARIRELGGGYPLNTYVLGQADPPEAGLVDLVDVLLDFVDENARFRVREALETLCILNRFREREIAMMVAHQRAEDELTMEEARGVRDLLLDHYLMRWENDGYVINESVRVAYRNYLKYRQASHSDGGVGYADMIDYAINMYREWSKKYPNAREHYLWQAQQLESLRNADSVLASNL